MSVGQSALGTLLVQRLDAVLGTTMAQHADLMSTARSNAVTQAGPPPSADPTDTSLIRDPRQAVERAQQQLARDPRAAVKDARMETALALLAARGRTVSSDSTASAPTSLGAAARIILALLAQFPDEAPPAQGRRPLWQPPADGNPARPGGAPAQGQSPAGTQQAAGQAGGTPAGPAAGAAGQAAGQAGGPAAASGQAGAAGQAGRPAQSGEAAGAGQARAAAAQAAGPAPGLPAPAQLARALASALDGSGMFYESHLAGLAFGKRTAAQLQGEPQARLGAREPAQDAGQAPSRPQAGQAGAASGQAAGAEAAVRQAAAAPAAQGASAPAGQAAATHLGATGNMPPEAALLVRQQLEVLANQVFSWRGEAWPDAPMWWEVGRDSPEAGLEAGAPAWATRLLLSLPRLGEVEARLSLAGNRLVMHLAAPDSAALLQEHAGQLRERYSAAGFALTRLSVDDAGGDTAGYAEEEARTGAAGEDASTDAGEAP